MKHHLARALLTVLTLSVSAFLGAHASAQGTQVPFGGMSHDNHATIEVSADMLDVSQTAGTATFSGNVIVGQGDLRLSAGLVEVEYDQSQEVGRIVRLRASGGVTLVSKGEAAEAREAVYDLEAARVTLTGDVLLSQGDNALAGDRLVIDLDAGTARVDGRVRTILNPGSFR